MVFRVHWYSEETGRTWGELNWITLARCCALWATRVPTEETKHDFSQKACACAAEEGPYEPDFICDSAGLRNAYSHA